MPVRVCVEPKDQGSVRASPRGGVCRHRGAKVRGEAQAPDRRCGTVGTGGHATVKSSIHKGTVRDTLARAEGGGILPDRITEVSRGHRRRAEGLNGREEWRPEVER